MLGKRFYLLLGIVLLSLVLALVGPVDARTIEDPEGFIYAQVLQAVANRASGDYVLACLEYQGEEEFLRGYGEYNDRTRKAQSMLSNSVVSKVTTSEGSFSVPSDQLFVAALRGSASCEHKHYAVRVSPNGDYELLWTRSKGAWTSSPIEEGDPLPYPGGLGSAVVLLEDGTAVAVQYALGQPVAYSIPELHEGLWLALPRD